MRLQCPDLGLRIGYKDSVNILSLIVTICHVAVVDTVDYDGLASRGFRLAFELPGSNNARVVVTIFPDE